LKLDSNGNITWQKTYGPGYLYSSWIGSVQQTSDGGYIVAGSLESSLWLLKLNSDGNIAWQKIYKGDNSACPACSQVEHSFIQQTRDSGFIVASALSTFGGAWLLKLDANGDVVWQRIYNGGFWHFSLQQTSDDGYVVSGAISSSNQSTWDFWLLKLDANGNIQWEKTYGSNKYGELSYPNSPIQQTLDGGYILAGVTFAFGAGNEDFWVLKVDEKGNIGGSCGIIGSSNSTVMNTNASPTVSSANSVDTKVVITNIATVTPADSNVITTEQCSSN
jgi:hypothetical protein